MVFSYSRLTGFESCKYKWFLKYIKHETGPSGFFAEYGSFMHHILETHLSGNLSADDAPIYYISNYSDHIKGKPPNAKIGSSFYSQGLKYLNTLDFPRKNIIEVEKKVQCSISGHDYLGFIDVLSEGTDGGLIITDHKSHPLKPFSKNYPGKKLQSDITLENYLRQLYLYAEAVHQTMNIYPKILEFNSFREQNYISVPFEQRKLDETLLWAEETRNTIALNSEWNPNIDFWTCNYLCEVNRSCEYFKACHGRAFG